MGRCNEEDEERNSIKIKESGLYEVVLSGLTMQEPGDIGKINLMKKRDGVDNVLSTAFTHIKNAWHDSGIHFSNITLPFNSQVLVTLKEGDELWIQAEMSKLLKLPVVLMNL